MSEIREHARFGRPFVLLETEIAGVPYQIVAHLLFDHARPPTLTGFAGFTISLNWVREAYFGPLLNQVASIGGQEDSLFLSVRDEAGSVVATSGSNPTNAFTSDRTFPLLFLDPAVASRLQPTRPAVREWTVHVQPAGDRTVAAARTAASRAFLLMSLAALVCATALLLTIRAARASARLAAMQADFVSTVTHELKTPLASVRLVGDTLAKGRYSSNATVQEYALLLSQEAARLTHSIDNVLTYARYREPQGNALDVRQVDVGHLVDEALERVGPRLVADGFEVTVDVPRELPRIAVDRTAMLQVIENVVDNALKYSGDRRILKIIGRTRGRQVSIVFTDEGIGIPLEDLPRVFERFFRASNAKRSGSGLGLAIARRIIRHHGGDIAVRSTLGQGTEIDVMLPAIP